MEIVSHPGDFKLNDTDALPLKMDAETLSDWNFIGHPWRVDEQGVMRPAFCKADHHMAFYTAQAFGDFDG